MKIDTKYNLEQEVAVVYDQKPCKGVITGIKIYADTCVFMIKYEVIVYTHKDEEIGPFTYDENHIYKNKNCKAISIELASQLGA